MLDANKAQLTKVGTLSISSGKIVVSGFDGDGCTCRDISALAIIWAIGQLQSSLLDVVREPGKADHVVFD